MGGKEYDEYTERLKKYGVGAGWHTSRSDENVHYTTRSAEATQHHYPDGSKKVIHKKK
ncbi:MAG: hypothetical protein J7K36_05030 [Archaeoglobaceae archaeon]|nr:hypothetical protein [Archaeoglobaceae archaeon]